MANRVSRCAQCADLLLENASLREKLAKANERWDYLFSLLGRQLEENQHKRKRGYVKEDEEIARLHHAGLSYSTIAARKDMEPEAVRKRYKRHIDALLKDAAAFAGLANRMESDASRRWLLGQVWAMLDRSGIEP
jgi:RNase P subunit RPR2